MSDMKQFDEFIQMKGYKISGAAEVGLTFKDALSAVTLAKEARLSILGGDVYLLKEGKTIPAYANWYSDRYEEESIDDYAKRTWKEAEEYLQRFPKNDSDEVLFVLVVARG